MYAQKERDLQKDTGGKQEEKNIENKMQQMQIGNSMHVCTQRDRLAERWREAKGWKGGGEQKLTESSTYRRNCDNDEFS